MTKPAFLANYLNKDIFHPQAVLWLVIFIALGAFMRLYALETKAILFNDAGSELLIAENSLNNKQLTLDSQSNSHHAQGAISFWYSILIVAMFGENTYALSISYALLSIAALIAAYELVCVTINRNTALFSTLLIAVSPLAIAGARVPYHTTPIPLFTVFYLIALYRLWQKKPWSLLWAGISFGLLFQFELILAPLLLMIPFVLWRSQQLKTLISKPVRWLILGLIIGLLPQIIFDLTHKFAQLSEFVLWIRHKGLEFITFKGAAETNSGFLINNFGLYTSRVFSTSWWIGGLVILIGTVGLIWLGWRSWQSRHKSQPQYFLPKTGQILLACIVLLSMGYVINGVPSEAYFPAFTILLPILLAVIVFQLPQRWKKILVTLLIIVSVFNVYSIFSHNFFVSTDKEWNYGPGLGEQKQVVYYIASRNDESGYQLRSSADFEKQFPNHFANYEWISRDINVNGLSAQGKKYLLSTSEEQLPANYMQKKFETLIVGWLPEQR